MLGARRERGMKTTFNIDDAIGQCEAAAAALEKGYHDPDGNWCKCASIAAENRQMAEWLRELKKLKSEDAVNREACIAAINETIAPYIPRLGGSNIAIPLQLAMAIKKLPPARGDSWIPCSERLPEKTDCYLIQYSREACPDEMSVAFYSVEEAEIDNNYTWEFKPIADCKEVIAWQPLPEQYEEGSGKE